jgi:hypothetical protein
MFRRIPPTVRALGMFAFLALTPSNTRAQQMEMPTDASGWHVMQEGVFIGMFNHQGGPRGGDEFKFPNWWMGMFGRRIGSSHLTVNTMLSLDPATVGKKGYREIFQIGETFEGQPLVDRQHPHDFFMQLAAVWRVPIGAGTGFTVAGAPVGEPALGPVAFMHRASTGENPLAPLSHHTFDSTHIAFGVVTAALDRGPWMFEASAFNGREPDEHRWDFDFGRLDSFSGRVWFRPSDEWEFQVSSARLREPEELEPGDIIRTTGSVSWLKRSGEDFTAVTVAVGHNGKDHGDQSSLLGEAAHRVGRTAIYGRFEAHQVETSKLSSLVPPDQIDSVWEFTVGGLRDVLRWRGVQGGVGAGITLYAVPEALELTHGERPVSFQLFFRLRPVAGVMGRMWNMHMVKPMKPAADPHAGHHMN